MSSQEEMFLLPLTLPPPLISLLFPLYFQTVFNLQELQHDTTGSFPLQGPSNKATFITACISPSLLKQNSPVEGKAAQVYQLSLFCASC